MTALPSMSLRERVETAIARRVARLPAALARRLAGRTVEIDGFRLDPNVQLILRLHGLSSRPGPGEVPLEQARRELEVTAHQLAHRGSRGVSSAPLELAGRPARIYRPADAASAGSGVLYLHGGGFVLGSLDSHDDSCRQIAARLGAPVVALDYRLAPEHRFPAAVDDAVAGFRALVERAPELGVDASRLGVAGDSAGGNLSLLVGLETRSDRVRPAALLAIYPATDLTMSSASHQSLATGYFLEGEHVQFYRRTYLDGADPRHPRVSPLFREDLDGMPPTVLVTAGFDPLRDEGDLLAEKLRGQGGEVDHLRFGGLFHGFLNTPLIRTAAEAIEALLARFERRLARP